MTGKGLAARRGRARPVDNLATYLGEEQREDAETFGERHTDDGLHEDLAGSAGLRPTASAALVPIRPTPMAAPSRPNALVMLPEIQRLRGFHHGGWVVLLCGVRRAHALARSRRKRVSGGIRRSRVVVGVIVIIAVVADEPM
jgi:hypothetical protein